MCDYSLGGIKNRLAETGEQLSPYKFDSGTTGLVSSRDLPKTTGGKAAGGIKGLAQHVQSVIRLPKPACAVCVPPGAKLLLTNIPSDLQTLVRSEGAEQEVVFDQLGVEVNQHRDAVRFSNGKTLSLQSFRTGMQVKVLSLESAREGEVVQEFIATTTRR